jgi:hypothetical protein
MTTPARIAVCIHVYYETQWDLISAPVRNMGVAFDLFVTCRPEMHDIVARRVARDFPRAETLAYENLGMDVLPFLALCRDRNLAAYDVVLKLHTKNRRTPRRAEQGRLLLDGLCGSRALVDGILDTFARDPQTGMIGGAFQVRSAMALMYGNRSRVDRLIDRLGLRSPAGDLADWPFLTGTMFWIAGRLLAGLAGQVDHLLDSARTEGTARSGADGTIPHAVERLFGAVVAAAGMRICVTERRTPDQDTALIVPLAAHGPCHSRAYLESDSLAFLDRHAAAGPWTAAVRDAPQFDPAHYVARAGGLFVAGMDPAYHFVLYGDILGLDPGPAFSVNHYLIARPDVAVSGRCSLEHYLRDGQAEGSIAAPTDGDWLDLAQARGLFDPSWYAARYPDVAPSGLGAHAHYLQIGRILGRATSAGFHPLQIGTVRMDGRGRPGCIEFLRDSYRREGAIYEALARAGENGDHRLAGLLEPRIIADFGPTRASVEAVATCRTLQGDRARASRDWRRLRDAVRLGTMPVRHQGSVTHFNRKLPAAAAVPDLFGPPVAIPPAAMADLRICLYTAVFGADPDPLPVLSPAEGVDHLCLTDRPRIAPGWRQVIVVPGTGRPALDAAMVRILPHRFLPDHDASLYVAPDLMVAGRTAALLARCLQAGSFAAWPDPLRADVALDAAADLATLEHDPDPVLDRLADLAAAGLPQDSGLIDLSVLWRRHGAERVRALMDLWWRDVAAGLPERFALGGLMWREQTRPALMPASLGPPRHNEFFAATARPAAIPAARPAPPPPRPAGRPPRDVVFLQPPAGQDGGAGDGAAGTRGSLLCRLLMRHYSGQRRVLWTADPDVGDSIVILTGDPGLVAGQVLRPGRSNIVIADIAAAALACDPDAAAPEGVHARIAPSLTGMAMLLRAGRDAPVFHVPHPPGLPARAQAAGGFSAGHFGLLPGAGRSVPVTDADIAALVAFHQGGPEAEAAAGRHSLHYAVTRGGTVADPFVAGFLAARCGANVLATRDCGDALHYLGSDYPFLLPAAPTPGDILNALCLARAVFDTDLWQDAGDILHEVADRSSDRAIAAEFDTMLQALGL